MVGTAVLQGSTARLEELIHRYQMVFENKVQRKYFAAYVRGLLGPAERKSVEPIALEQGVPVLALQRFIGQAPWDDERLLTQHGQDVQATLGAGHGVLVLDSTSAPKRGEHSVGVKRQWCGQLGKEENCQVWVNLEYASEKGHTLVSTPVDLDPAWRPDGTHPQ